MGRWTGIVTENWLRFFFMVVCGIITTRSDHWWVRSIALIGWTGCIYMYVYEELERRFIKWKKRQDGRESEETARDTGAPPPGVSE